MTPQCIKLDLCVKIPYIEKIFNSFFLITEKELNERAIYSDISSMKGVRFLAILSWMLLFLPFSVFSLQKTHIVEKGETLYSLAREYRVSVSQLAEANHLSVEAHIKVGQKLVIPEKNETKAVEKQEKNIESKTPTTHVVLKGETLYAIAARYKTTVEKIVKDNDLKNNTIFVGQKLSLHSHTAAVKPSEKTNKPTEASKTPTQTQTAAAVPVKNKAVIAVAPEKKSNGATESVSGAQKKKVVSSNKNWPASGEVYYFRGKIPGIEIDIKGKNDIFSVCNGTIKTASAFRGYGHVVVVESLNNMLYTYAGFDSIIVKEGDIIKAGEKLGEMNPDSPSAEPKIYLFVYQNGTPVNPVSVPRFR